MRKADPARKTRPKNPALSTYLGADDAGGPSKPVKAVLARRGDIAADLKVRFRFMEQTDFIRQAAAKTDPPESLNLFLATAGLERAAKVLGRPAPDPPSSECSTSN